MVKRGKPKTQNHPVRVVYRFPLAHLQPITTPLGAARESAKEPLQDFTLGLCETNQDGSGKRNGVVGSSPTASG